MFTHRCGLVIESIAVSALSMISLEALAADPIESEVRIERQSLRTAMWQLREQTHVLIFSLDDAMLNETLVGPVVGRMSPQEALRRLLAGTPFISRRTDSGYEVLPESLIQGPTMPPLPPGGGAATRAPARNSMTVLGDRIHPARSAPEFSLYDARSLDRVGVSTVGELLTYLLEQPNVSPETVQGDGAQYADLRGVGMDMGTILINGRPVSPTATSGTAFDLNNIPLSAVESVDVLDDSAAAEMGVRSIGGVVNIRLKSTYSAPTVRLVYGAAQGGAEERQVVLSAGSSGDRLVTGLSAEYSDRSELPGDARSFSRDQNYSRYGGADYRSLASWPGNISSTTGAPLPGLLSPYAAIPIGTGDGDPQISDFQNTAGIYRLDSLRRFSSLLPAARRLSVVGTAEYTFESWPNVRLFGELMGVDRWTEYQFTPPTLLNALVPAINAFNPFDQPVYVSRLLSEVGPREVTTDSQWLRVVGGIAGDVGSWSWEVAASRSEESASRSANNALDPVQVARALSSSDRDMALNVFGDGPIGTPELTGSLVAEPSAMKFGLTGSDVSAALRGPVLSLPSGDVNVLLGAAWRQEITSLTRTMSIWHAGVSVPLWGDALTAAANIRSDRCSDLDEVVTPAYALTWEPSESLQFRLSHATGFRAPSAQELYGASYALQFPVADRRRNGEVRNVTVHVGSSEQIQTVTGESTALSARIKPPGDHPGWQIVAKYWRKRVDNRIMAIPMSQVLAHEAAFPEHVVRDAPTPEDLAAGRPGILRSLDLLTTNVGGIDASGIDATLSYEFNRNIYAELSATWMDEFVTYDVPGVATNRIGIANPRGTISRWRGFAKVGWLNEYANVTLSARRDRQ